MQVSKSYLLKYIIFNRNHLKINQNRWNVRF